MNAGIVPGLVAVDQCGRPLRAGDRLAPCLDRSPRVEPDRLRPVVDQLAPDKEPADVGADRGPGVDRAGPPAHRKRSVPVWQWVLVASVPSTVDLDGAGCLGEERAVAGRNGKGAGPLAGLDAQ